MVWKKSPWCVIGTSLCHPVDHVCRYNLSSKRNMCLSWLIAFIGQDQMSFNWLLRTTGSPSPLSLLISVTVRNYRGSWWHPTTECIQICKRFSVWFGLGKNFFSQPLVIEFFFPDIHGCKNFFQNYTPLKIFFSVQKFFPPGISLQKLVSFEISLWDTFFLKSPITSPPPQKPNGRSLRASSCVPFPSWGGLRDEQKERLLR